MQGNATLTDYEPAFAARMMAASILGLCLLFAAAAAPGSARAAGAQPNCANQDLRPGQLTQSEQRAAITCLISYERKRRDRAPLKKNEALTKIARSHNALMLKTECFRHRCPGERPLAERIEKSAYLKGGGRYGFGENLGCANTPRAQVSAWMKSTAHRRNILGKRFRHIGVGAGRGAPNEARPVCRDRGFATYTVIFAWRKR